MQHLSHRIVGEHENADYVHQHGFFVGNHHFDIRELLDYLKRTLDSI